MKYILTILITTIVVMIFSTFALRLDTGWKAGYWTGKQSKVEQLQAKFKEELHKVNQECVEAMKLAKRLEVECLND